MATLNLNFTLRQLSLFLFLIVNLISAAYIPPRRLTRPQLDQDQTHHTHPIIKRNPLPLPQEQDPNLLEVIPTATAQGLPTALPPIAPYEPLPSTAVYPQPTTAPYDPLPSTVVYPQPTTAPYEPLPSTAVYPPGFLAAKRNPSPLPQDPQAPDALKVIPTPPAGGDVVVVLPTPPPSSPPSPTPEPVVNPVPSPEPVTPLPPAFTPGPESVTSLPPSPPEAVTPLPEPVTPTPPAGEAPVFVTPVATKRTAAAARVMRRKLQLF